MLHPDVRIQLPMDKIREFCEKWKIKEFYLFGSVTSDAFRSESDVDVMVEPEPDAQLSLFDVVDMQDELRDVFRRDVDLIFRRAVERSRNPYRKKSILASSRLIYAA